MMNVVYDNVSVEFSEGNMAKGQKPTPVRIYWFCTHEALSRVNPPGTHRLHMHPDDVERVSEHVMYVPEYGSRAINVHLDQLMMAREEWAGLEFVEYDMWLSRKNALDAKIREMEEQRAEIPIRKVVVAKPKDLFINRCQHSDDRKDDRSCSVSLNVNPDSLPEYGRE